MGGAEFDGVDDLLVDIESIEQRWLGSPVTFQVGTNVEYAAVVEFGSDPHVIRPNDADGWLRFEDGGQVVYAKEVHHPGTAPQPFLEPALEEAHRKAPGVLVQADSLEQALLQLAMLTEGSAKRRTPVDSGRLRTSIRYWRID